MTFLMWHRCEAEPFVGADAHETDAFVPIALLATDDLAEAFAQSSFVAPTDSQQVIKRFAGPSTREGDVIERVSTHERFLMVPQGFTSLGITPPTAIAAEALFLVIWRSDGGKVLPLEASLTCDVWHGYALSIDYAMSQGEQTLDWVRAHVVFGERIRWIGPDEPGDDDLLTCVIDGQTGYAWICGIGREALGIDD